MIKIQLDVRGLQDTNDYNLEEVNRLHVTQNLVYTDKSLHKRIMFT